MSLRAESLTSLRDIARLIDQGSELFLLGECEMKAIAKYATVLRKLRDLEDDRGRSLRNSSRMNSDIRFEMTLAVTSSLIPQLHDRQFYIYNHICHFKISDDDHDGPTRSPGMLLVDFNVLSAIALFNSALGFHSVGKSKFDQRCLNKSLRFYEMCFLVLNQMANHHSSQEQLVNTLMVAAINNMSHIHFELHDFCSSENVLDSIFGLNLPSVPVDLDVFHGVAPVQWEEVFVNKLVAKYITVAPSA